MTSTIEEIENKSPSELKHFKENITEEEIKEILIHKVYEIANINNKIRRHLMKDEETSKEEMNQWVTLARSFAVEEEINALEKKMHWRKDLRRNKI